MSDEGSEGDAVCCPQRSSKAASVLQLVFVELGVVEVEFFGLKFCDNQQQTVRTQTRSPN